MGDPLNSDISLVSPCGFYCGACRHYLARQKGLLAEKNLKHGCKGCRAQDKNCAGIKKNCVLIRKHQVAFCHECPDFPCANLIKLDKRHQHGDGERPIVNLLRMRTAGAEVWLREQVERSRCPRCGGNLCLIGGCECYDCGYVPERAD